MCTVQRMGVSTLFRRRVQVYFYSVEPLRGSSQTFADGNFPAAAVLDAVSDLDLSTGDYHVAETLTGTSTVCRVVDGPVRVLVAYKKDPYSTFETERKGEFLEYELDDGEGILEPTFAVFFPNDVVALFRGSIGSPGASKIAHWLSLFSGCSMYFAPLPRSEIASRLNGPAGDYYALELATRRSRIQRIRGANKRVADALDAAARVGTSSKVGLKLGVETFKERPAWWGDIKPVIDDLAEVIPEFDRAVVKMSNDRDLDLRQAYVSTRATVEIDSRRRPRPSDAARALTQAYAEEEAAVLAAVAQWRSKSAGADDVATAEGK